ncbi:MAG TPA: glycosyltransferase family 2 protein [Thermoplasmata archaeon]|nr:glycosyltransferase family 2 protein [Thermoplasmata archaeon]
MLKNQSVPVAAVVRREFSESKIIAAIPAYNEEKTIGSVILATRPYVDRVLVVDDGSEDRTAWIAEQAGATVIQHQRNRGYGAALRSCFEYARTNGCEALVILDGDGQHRPEMIPRVIAPITAGEADVSIGSRFLEGRRSSSVPRYRKFGIGVITRLTNLGTHRNRKLRDAQSGFRGYSLAAIELINPREPRMGASTEILWEADRNGLRIVEVPIEVDYDRPSSGRGPVRHGLSVIGSMIRYVEMRHALLFFAFPGFCLFTVGVVLGLFVVEGYYRTTQLAVGLALVTVLMVVGGMLLSFTGLILHALINVNQRGA